MAPRSDSVISTSSGSGTAGNLRKGPDKDAIVVRRPPMAGNAYDHGSEMPPMYSDIPIEVVKSVQASLDESPPLGRLADNYDIVYPIGLVFNDNELSQAGIGRLQAAARQVKQLPFEILIQVGSARDFGKTVRVYQYLFETCDISPLRLGVALKPTADAEGMLVLSFRHPSR